MVSEINNYAGIFADPSIRRTILGIIPLYHFSGIHTVFNVGIATGATVVFVEKYSVSTLCHAIETFKVTSLPGAPPILIHLLNRPEVDKYDLSSLEQIGTGSAPIAPSVVTGVKEKFKTFVAQGYGMTETSPVITWQSPDWARPDSIGRVVPCMQSKIIDVNGRGILSDFG